MKVIDDANLLMAYDQRPICGLPGGPTAFKLAAIFHIDGAVGLNPWYRQKPGEVCQIYRGRKRRRYRCRLAVFQLSQQNKSIGNSA
jgi:hypothetical protein